MEKVNIGKSATVMLVKNIEETVEYYNKIKFSHEVIGSNPEHHHVHRDGVIFILHPANKSEDVRPSTSLIDNQNYYFDVYCYMDGVDLLAEEFAAIGVEIVRGPHYDKYWSEVTIKDINGYQIAFGGGIANKDLFAG